MISAVGATDMPSDNVLAQNRFRVFWLSCFRAMNIARLIVWHSTCYAIKLAAQLRFRNRTPTESSGQFLVGLVEALGPTFIKFGQVLSSRPDLIPEQFVQPLARLQDRVKPFDSGRIPGILAHEFGCDANKIFASLDETPLAAGSIAQVHRATLVDGRQVAVKVRRPHIDRLLECDLCLLRACGKLIGWVPWFRTVPFSEMVRDVGEPIRNQLDFVKEAEHNRQFRRNFASVEHIRFPALVDELCTPAVLTMEYVDGLIKLDAATVLDADSRRVAALAGLRALYKMIFIDGLIHADMHPGNVFVRQWGEFVVLDTGLVALLNPLERQQFAEFFFGIVNNDGLRCAQIVYEDATYRARHCDRDRFEADMVALIGRYATLKSHEFEVTKFVCELINTQRKHGLRGSTKFMSTILAMVVYDGICKQLHPTCDFQREARGYLITARYSSPIPSNQRDTAGPGRRWQSTAANL